MGKRELIIAIAFVTAGALAYQLTAAPPKPGQQRFSLSSVFSRVKREVQANAASAAVTKNGTVALRPGMTELRLTAGRSVPLTVTGERRDDIAYELWVESTGPDEATPRDSAGRATLDQDDLGVAQALAVHFAAGPGVQNARLALRVPSRLLVRVENAGRIAVSDVRAVDLRNLSGEATLTNVSDLVSGSHRSGDLTVTRAGAVDLALTSSRARFTEIDGAVTLNGRNGDCAIAKSRGSVKAVMSNAEFTITEHTGAVTVSGDGGTLRIALPSKELAIDVRQMLVEITLATAIPATIITTGDPLRLTLAGPPGVTIDAVATSGTVLAGDFALQATQKDRTSRLDAPIGGGGPRLVLRNSQADIVISLRK